MTIIGEQIRKSSNRELAQWLRDCEKKHPLFINTEAAIKDEMRRRDERKTKTGEPS